MPCGWCGQDFQRTNSAQKFCPQCAVVVGREKMRVSRRRFESKAPPRKRDPERQRERIAGYVKRYPERRAKAVRAYNEANREIINAKSRARNRTEKRRTYIQEWERRKAATDPAFVLNRRMKQAVRLALRGGKRGRSWESLVGYTVDDLRVHLERQFIKGMSWENMGDWHIDHVLPKASFNFTDAADPEFRECWTLTNLRPLWGVENLSKGAKRLHLI